MSQGASIIGLEGAMCSGMIPHAVFMASGPARKFAAFIQRSDAPSRHGRDTVCANGQLHVTLAFIGEAAPTFLPHLRQALDRDCAGVPALPCRAAGFGYFGSRRSPTVLWAGVEPAEQLESLHERLWQTLEPLGYEKPSPRFHPHITLARCKVRARNKAVLDAMDLSEDAVFGNWTAAGATLYESKLTPRGPRYHAVHTAPFAG